ncbi:MAG: hypothetical protein JWP61_1808, partial [Friedmanniella sp.]|nr:hypothetical protein [Friedmanniella sp.]
MTPDPRGTGPAGLGPLGTLPVMRADLPDRWRRSRAWVAGLAVLLALPGCSALP